MGKLEHIAMRLLSLEAVMLALCCAWISCDVVTAVDLVQDPEQQALLDNSKKLPETQEEKDKAYTTQALLRSYAGDTCAGASKTGTQYKVCVNAPSLEDCPKDVWHKGFHCSTCLDEKKYKCSQQIRTVTFLWTTYNNKFYTRMDTATESSKVIVAGKLMGTESGVGDCLAYKWDVRPVILMQKVWTPTCSAATPLGADLSLIELSETPTEKEAEKLENQDAETTAEKDNDKNPQDYIMIDGSFTLTNQ